MKSVSFKGKRFLITQNSLKNYAGSEITTLELANHLLSKGAFVTIFTFSYENPIAQEFPKNSRLKIYKNREVLLSFSQFDYIWVHHQILPKSMLKELDNITHLPVIIFHHMSYFVPLELPFINQMENQLASVSTFNSIMNQKKLSHFYSENYKNFKVYPNPVPDDFIKSSKKLIGNTKPRRLLIVSNHPPEEILLLRDRLRKTDVDVDILGDKGRKQLVKASTLLEYDVVVTIGKTCQYALVMGIPVYCYDHFGGPGYINDRNFKKASNHNFSGRGGFGKKPSSQIANEIVNNYSVAVSFSQDNLEKLKSLYSIDASLQNIFSNIKPKHLEKPLDNTIIDSFIATQDLLYQFTYNAIEAQNVISYHIEKNDAVLNKNSILKQNLKEKTNELQHLYRQKSVVLALRISSNLQKIKNLLHF